MKIINISFISLQLPSKCLNKDLIIENAESCFYWKNITGKKYWLQTCLGKKKCFFEFSTCSSNQIDQTAILCNCFLTFQRMSSAILDDWAPDESAAAKSSQRIKLRELSFIAQCIVRDDHLHGLLGWMALFGHSICLQACFGRVCAACCACPPALLQAGFTPSTAAVSAPSPAELLGCAREAAGWKAVREVPHMPCLQILLRFLLQEETAFGLIYISAAPVTAASAESWLVVRHSSTALVFPAVPSTPEHRRGRVLCLPCQSCMESSCCTSCGCGKGCKASSLSFLSDWGQLDRSHLKGRGWEGGTQRVGT